MTMLGIGLLRYLCICGFIYQTKSTDFEGLDELQNLEISSCAFPNEIQGAYKTQDLHQQLRSFPAYDYYELRDPIRYRDVYVGPSSIPLWGDCFESNGPAYILKLKKVGGFTCYRCFVIIQRTPNILQIHNVAEDICYANALDAKQSCVDAALVQPQEGIMLYRSEHVQYQYCPVGGRASLTYSSGGGRLSCPYPSSDPSTISNCKFGYQLDVSLRGCTFPTYDLSFRCLGTWDFGKGNGETLFAVYNIAAEEYRCGIFKEIKDTAGPYAVAALSNDSSCINMLFNSSHGYERFAFFRDPQTAETTAVQDSGNSLCTFPEWMQGEWETMSVKRESINFYPDNDPTTLSTIFGKCGDFRNDKMKILSKSHCGDTLGTACIWWTIRSASVAEIKLIPASISNDNCLYEKAYANISWSIVSAKTSIGIDKLAVCPFFGQYTTSVEFQKKGRYCYNISSDCSKPYQFTMIKFLCGSNSVYENSSYQCMASWSEDDGVHNVYVNKTDDGTKSCFVMQTDKDGRIFISRGWKQCQRNVDFARLLAVQRFESPVIVVQEKSSCLRSNSATLSPFDRVRPNLQGKPNNAFDRGRNVCNSTKQDNKLVFKILLTLIIFVMYSVMTINGH